jgi:hypothetical protein
VTGAEKVGWASVERRALLRPVASAGLDYSRNGSNLAWELTALGGHFLERLERR